MKTMKRILPLFLLPLLCGLFAFGGHKASKTSEVKADGPVLHNKGFFERVTSIDQIEDGDQLLLSRYHQVLNGFSGNPAYYYFKDDGDLHFTKDRKILGIDDGDYALFTVKTHSNDEYTFRSTMQVGLKGPFDVLLGFNNTNSTGFDNVGSFDPPFGVYKYSNSMLNDSRTHWTLKAYNYEYNNIQLRSCSNKDYAYSFDIYRLSTSKYFDGQYELDLDTYYYNDDICLDGYYVNIYDDIYSDRDYRLNYSTDPGMFYMKDSKAKAGVTEYTVYIHGVEEGITVHVDEITSNPGYWFEYLEPTQGTKDYRGSYLLVETEEGGHFYNGRYPSYHYSTCNSSDATISNGRISVQNTFTLEQVIILDKVQIDGLDGWHYVAKNKAPGFDFRYYNNPYYNEQMGYYDHNEFIEVSDEYSEEDIVYVRENGNGGLQLAFKNKYDQYYEFSYDNSHENFFFETRDDYQNARLFKLSKTEEQQLVDFGSFISKFNSVIECDQTGESRYVFEDQWGQVKSEFNILNEDAKGYLANLTYTPTKEVSGSLKDIINKYDVLISRYNDLDDFMDRRSVTTWASLVDPQLSINYVFENNQNSSMTIVILVSVTSITLLAALVFIKKRKAI